MNVRAFQEDTFGFCLHLLWDLDGPHLAQYIRINFPEIEVDEEDEQDNWDGRHAKLEFARDGQGYEIHLVALRSFELTPLWISMLSHEVLHATHEALASRGIRLTDDTKEVFCYLHESLLRRCLQHITGNVEPNESALSPRVS